MVEGQINSGPDDELATTAKMLLEESDRGCAVFGAQMIDDQLKVFLTTLLNRDDEYDKVLANLLHGYGPLASFSARLDVAYVMGALTSEQYQSIQIVRKIRNRMAHDRGPVTFEHETVRQLFRLLVAGGKRSTPDEEVVTLNTANGPRSYRRTDLTNRIAFLLSVTQLMGSVEYATEICKNLPTGTLWQVLIGTLPRSLFRELKQKMTNPNSPHISV